MVQSYRLFVASPGDVQEERSILRGVIRSLNQSHGKRRRYRLKLVRWETDVAPGAGRPQQVINDQVGSYDVFVGIMWHRFGTPTGVADSGTVEEFRNAYRAWKRNRAMPLMFYFCQKPFMPRSIEEVDQMRRVLLFRKALEGKALFWDYSGPVAFSRQIGKHLCLRMDRFLEDRGEKLLPRTLPDDKTIGILKGLWNRMSPDLQRAFSVAYNENRRKGDGGIQTRDLFAALLRVRPKQLEPIVASLPRKALPPPTRGPVVEEPYIIGERPWLSHCVASSIRRLSRRLPAGRELTAADIFADIAKNGTGESVRLLREHKIGPKEIDRILKRKNIQVVGD
jgi:hypothetical protein